MIAEYLPRVLGGTGSGWADANVWAFDRQWERWEAATLKTSGGNIREWFEADAATWLYDMCEMVGVPRPPAQDAMRIANAVLTGLFLALAVFMIAGWRHRLVRAASSRTNSHQRIRLSRQIVRGIVGRRSGKRRSGARRAKLRHTVR